MARWRNWRVVAVYQAAGFRVTVEKSFYAPSRYHAVRRFFAQDQGGPAWGTPEEIRVEVASDE